MSEIPPSSSREQILTVLRAEVELQQQHLELLVKQKAALVGCDRLQFGSLHAKYEQMLDDLEHQAAQRSKAFPPNADILQNEINSWPAQPRGEAMELVRRLRLIGARATEQAVQNQALIANDLKLVNFKLDLFMSAGRRGPYYVSTGRAVAATSSRLINRTI